MPSRSGRVRSASASHSVHLCNRCAGLVVRDALFMAMGGLVVGLAAAVPMSRLMTTLLFELTPTDPVTLGTVVTVLFGVALLASYLPARRASRVDPRVALRAD
jgi:ABC-type antimicrobial peptide transport system permease subunit